MATSVQTAYTTGPAIGVAGGIATEGPRDVESSANSSATGITPGTVVVASGSRTVRPILVTDEPSAVADSIMTSHASATTKTIVSGAGLNGTVGAAVVWPPRNVTATLNSHADWNDTVLEIKGEDEFGNPIEESLVIPEGGNVTLTGVKAFSKVTQIIIPPGTSTNGTITVGLGTTIGALNGLGSSARGIALYQVAREPGTFAQYEDVGVMRKGRVYVNSETAVVRGGKVFVRVVATGSQVRGAVRGTADVATCGYLLGAEFADTTSGAGIVPVDINLPAA